MSVASAIYDALAGHAGVQTLVGTRVYPDIAPQDAAFPRLVWQEVSTVPVNAMDGYGNLVSCRVQVTSWSRKATDARSLDAQVRLAMAASTQFKSLHIEFRSLGLDEETRSFGVQSDFSVWLKG